MTVVPDMQALLCMCVYVHVPAHGYSSMYLDSLHGAGGHSALPVALVRKYLNKAGNDAVDVSVEALKSEGCQVAS